ncbi:hypothetical protein [Pseudoalteromonas sp. PPB1]|uniref:hypothetical protein n=1 Tax=Pseudoalteromonas sp. PPB1 TaxID=2756136 RepID=UPI001890E830|nr:hypothetical protein [Pseudoalteromonas sp. PPB1]
MTKSTSKFEIGQVWTCRSLSPDREHKAHIISIDEFSDDNIIGIVVISEGSADSPFMPFSLEAFSASAIELIDCGRGSDCFKDGYMYWKELYIAGEAGVYDISVDEVLSLDS